MTLRAVSILLLVLLSPAAGRQPATATGAIEAREKLEPKSTPIGTVVKLLKDLASKVEAQGKDEAAAYDKYACFCKDHADDKQYAIEKSTKLIGELDAQMTALKGELKMLSAEIKKMNEDIDQLKADIKKNDEKRHAEHEEYLANDAEMVAAIDACERATEAIKESKAAMEGKTNTGAKLAQVRAVASAASQKGFVVLTAEQEAALHELSRGPTDGETYAAKFHSNEVIVLLDDLKNQFIEEKNRFDTNEFETKKDHDNEQLLRANKLKFTEMDKAEAERIHSKKDAELATATENWQQENHDKAADEKFLGVLTGECQEKANLWDQRSQTRANELQALGKAIEELEMPETGAVQNWKANKQLNDLQTHKVPSFLQLRGGHPKQRDVREKVMALLTAASERAHSSVLAMVSLRIQASDDPDPFVKVRQLMKDLIARLEADAAAEASAKEICDKGIKKAVGERDEAAADKEESAQGQTLETAKAATLTEQIATLSDQIAENKAAARDASRLRGDEQRTNFLTVRDAEAGLDSVNQAIHILESFYGASMLQKGKSGEEPEGGFDYVPFVSKDSDRTGKTVDDYAPEVFDDKYHGEHEASKGIFGLLTVIKEDFERTIRTTKDAENQAQSEYDGFIKSNQEDTQTKDGSKTTKKGELTAANEAVLTYSADLSTATKEHSLSEQSLEALRASCVEKEETYAERVAKREQEVEALKEAHAILEDWESQ